MPIKSNKSIEEQIRHGEHLTFVDKLRASVRPSISRNEVTGREEYPREQFLTEQAAMRKREADRARRK